MIKFNHYELENLIESDAPFGDLTTSLINNKTKMAVLEILTRGEIIASCLSVVEQICAEFGAEFGSKFKDDDQVSKDILLMSVKADFATLHHIYKSIQNLLEYACGIATSANLLVKSVKKVDQNCEVLVTRKVFPFAKKLCLKAALDGGANIHRLGLSDSVLFFDTHMSAYQSKADFLAQIINFKAKIPERKIIIEASDIKFAKMLLNAGSDGVQCDKMSADEVLEVVEFKNANFKNAIILAAGGINHSNAQLYAKTGINAIVTSAIYKGVADLGARIAIL